MWQDLLNGYSHALQFSNLLAIIAGSFLGFMVGAFPALDTTVATALMVPLTFTLPPTQAILMLSAIYCSGVYAGQIPAILFRIPGSGEAIMTTFDGCKLAEKGQANKALGYGLSASVVGGVIGSMMLTFGSLYLVNIALKFGPAEYFALGVFAIVCISGLSGKSIIKGLIIGAIGMLLATVGIDSIAGMPRFTFGSKVLLGGIGFLPATIGLFAGAEVFKQVARDRPFSISIGETDKTSVAANVKQKIRIELPRLSEFFLMKWTILKSAIIGGLIGLMPGVGGTTAAIVSYGEAVRSSKHPETFGEGEIEGVVAPEVANNAAAPAAMIPMLCLGIPGSANTAIILGAFMIHGIDAGPLFLIQQKEIAFTIFAGVLLAQFVFFSIAFVGVIPFLKLRSLPGPFLAVFILSFAIVGTAATGEPYAMPLAVIMGIFGYILERYGFPLAPIVFGMVLGPIIEKSLRRAMVITQYDFIAVVSRPITLTLLLGAVLVVCFPLVKLIFRNRKSSIDLK